MGDEVEDWDRMIEQYDRTHRSASISVDDDDMPPPPPPPPPASRPPPPPSTAPPGVGGIAAALNARFAVGGGPRPPPPPSGPQDGGLGGLAAALAARNASSSRRDSHPPPPPPPSMPPPPVSSSPPMKPPPPLSSSPAGLPPPPIAAGSSPAAGGGPSLMKVVGAAASGLWGLIQNASIGAGADPAGPLAPVMQELSQVYQPFPDSSALAQQPSLRRNLSATTRVVVTAPKIKRRGVGGSSLTSGASRDDDDDAALWEDHQRATTDLSEREWLRFIEPKSGSVLYLNMRTNSAQGERPPEYDGSDDEDDDEDDVEDYLNDTRTTSVSHRRNSIAPPGMPQPVNFASPRRARQESIILNEAWDDKKGSMSGPSSQSGSSALSLSGIDPRLLGEKARSDGSISTGGTDEEQFVPLKAVDAGSAAAAAKPAMSVESFLSSTTLYSKQLEQLLEGPQTGGPSLSRAVELKLKSLLTELQEVQTLMDSNRDGDSGNEVDSLVLLDKLPWDFTATNLHVQRYRKQAWEIQNRPSYQSYHTPQYLSTFPLPPDTKAVTIVVKLPDIANNGLEGAAATTRIGVNTMDTCAAAVAMAFKKCEGKLMDRSLTVNNFVLKGMGIADFMYGDAKIMDYECIRMAVRNGEEVKLSLVRKPDPVPDPEEVGTFIENYHSKVDESIVVHDPNVAFQNVVSRDMRYIPMSELTHLPFRFKVLSVDNVTETSIPRFETISNLYLKCYVFYGCKDLASPMESEVLERTSDPRWFQWMIYKDLTIANLPRGARLGFILYGRKITKPEKEVMVAWTSHQLVDDQGFLSTGRLSLKLWSMEARKKGKHGKPREPEPTFLHRATTAQNLADPQCAVLTIQLDEFNLPVVSPTSETPRAPNSKLVGIELPLSVLSKDQMKQFDGLLACDILKELTQEDQVLLWNMRHHLVLHPAALGKFLQCVQWGLVEHRMEAYRLLKIWAQPASPVSALELLDAKFPDPVVRDHAIGILRSLQDDQLRAYLLQLVQCLKFEPYHNSPLKRFLVERALASPMNIGHYFFWHLKAEVHAPHCCERFGLILEEYLSYAGRFTLELKKQASAVLKLQRVAEMVVRLKRDHGYSDPEAMKEYTKECEKLNKDFFAPQGKFQLPLDPKIEVTTLVVEKCRYMSSKMVPLWLVFKNADPDAPNVYVIFKSGDDLRQDILTLQILTLMDALWLGSGLDCRMKPYKCIATGVNEHNEGVGLIEVVLNSDTTSGIQLKYGGGAVGALKMDPIERFLRDHNRIDKDHQRAVDNFVCSCAGYCVATFVLGIGDRHNGNIMVTKDGHLFHIDFGHFLGNFKQKFGINRERAAFVFTPEMAFVMGGSTYRKSAHFKKFLHFCARAFLTLRKHANLLENLFGLMVAAGMPELIKESDIYYMRDKLLLNEKESKAEKKLNEEIENSLDSKYRRFDNFIHNWRHG